MSPAQPRFSLLRNAITIFGAALTTTGAVLFLAFFLLELAGMHPNPYLGMLFFLICPGLFVAGLLVMRIGVCRKTWRVLVTKPSGRPEGAESRPRSWMRRFGGRPS